MSESMEHIKNKIKSIHKELGEVKNLVKEIRDVKKRLMKVEKAIEFGRLTKEDLREIRISEDEIKSGKYVTLEQAKKELGIE